tara:strand:+ start:2158 stop:2415 length:258 start_codon:yes stop_codon:yes gene_type:complete
MKKSIIILIIVIVVLLGVVISALSSKTTYKPFRLERPGTGTNFCEYYYEECNCYGKLLVMESYPMQYQCNGIKNCKDINETVCRE